VQVRQILLQLLLELSGSFGRLHLQVSAVLCFRLVDWTRQTADLSLLIVGIILLWLALVSLRIGVILLSECGVILDGFLLVQEFLFGRGIHHRLVVERTLSQRIGTQDIFVSTLGIH